MSDLRQQLQKHYDAQSLPAGKAEAILAEGRAAAEGGEKVVELPARRVTFWRALPAIAAAILLLGSLALWWAPQRGKISYALFAPRVRDFFSTPPELPKRSQNPEELRTWLLAQGAPAGFQIPAKLRSLKSFGCQVVNVHGKSAYLTCFWREKKPRVDDGELVHLLVARRKDFKDAPPTGVPQFRTVKDWSFAAWTEGDVIYTMAAHAPMETLQKFVRNAGARAPFVALAKVPQAVSS
ncbi:hypothetical protein CfE428DRAFT_0610 [Chthoniobacter flavus Ellin428]|uniref:Uncharacterized protein n=1 Tax=Chthoniobacter flavus Ellin428 TaxID=497964 RepID=B4CVC3_9BACT|nr:hypothetical protein [Chthoniobacter flavus]EDY21365.1 hypothetical protein CfE428DRAFT_0610 [Chthoniobacter flavus Ellin428]TCO95330.1 hypothetical protein EV701_10116 [Chthoniobacter flavus]